MLYFINRISVSVASIIKGDDGGWLLKVDSSQSNDGK